MLWLDAAGCVDEYIIKLAKEVRKHLGHDGLLNGLLLWMQKIICDKFSLVFHSFRELFAVEAHPFSWNALFLTFYLRTKSNKSKREFFDGMVLVENLAKQQSGMRVSVTGFSCRVLNCFSTFYSVQEFSTNLYVSKPYKLQPCTKVHYWFILTFVSDWPFTPHYFLVGNF